MKRILYITAIAAALAVGMVLATPKTAQALTLSMESGSGDLQQLVVGDTFVVNVVLSGLSEAENLSSSFAVSPTVISLDFLRAGIDFNTTRFSPSTITPGPIVPDTDAFVGGTVPGYVTGSFSSLDALSGAVIYSNGIFFSFEQTARLAGSGDFAFDFVSVSRPIVNQIAALSTITSQTDPVIQINAGPVLAYNVSPAASNPVPEPVTALLGVMGLGALGLATGRRRLQA